MESYWKLVSIFVFAREYCHLALLKQLLPTSYRPSLWPQGTNATMHNPKSLARKKKQLSKEGKNTLSILAMQLLTCLLSTNGPLLYSLPGVFSLGHELVENPDPVARHVVSRKIPFFASSRIDFSIAPFGLCIDILHRYRGIDQCFAFPVLTSKPIKQFGLGIGLGNCPRGMIQNETLKSMQS